MANARTLQLIPVITPLDIAELEATEREVRARYLDQYGCEPGVVWTREAASKLCRERRAAKAVTP